jgi:hypothetical protein
MASRDDEDLNRARRKERKGDDDDDDDGEDEEVTRLHSMWSNDSFPHTHNLCLLAVKMNPK